MLSVQPTNGHAFRIKALPPGSRVNIPSLVSSIPQLGKRHFAKLLDNARRKRKSKSLQSNDDGVTRPFDFDVDTKINVAPRIVGESRESSAATVIQSSFRVDRAKTGASQMQESFIEREAELALANRAGFLDIVAEMLYNTCFNLLDEALHDEFNIYEEIPSTLSIHDKDIGEWNTDSISASFSQ